MNLHEQIMNLPCSRSPTWPHRRSDYDQGHRDARHAAAELAIAADSERDELLTVARMIGAHYSASLDHQPGFVKLARAVLARAVG